MPCQDSTERRRKSFILHPLGRFIFFVLLLTGGGLVFFVGPETAWMNPPSDAIEYAVSARRLVTNGTYDLMLNGMSHPPRYSPGFSLLFLTPVYWLNGDHFGYGIFSVFACAVIVLVILWYICRRLLQEGWRGIAAASVILFCLTITPFYLVRAREIMSDIPLIALSLIALILYRRAWKRAVWFDFLFAGLLTAALLWIRITYLSVVTPFAFLVLRDLKKIEVKNLIALIGPVSLGVGGLLYYNMTTFGDPFFTGYQYWLAPRGYALNIRYFWPNLVALANPFLMFTSTDLSPKELIGPVFLIGVLIVCVLCRKRKPRLWAEVSFILHFMSMDALPIFVFHLFYPWHTVRFVLLFYTLIYLLGSVCFVGLFDKRHERVLAAFSVILILATVAIGFPEQRSVGFSHYEVVNAADKILPKDAYFISNLNGIYVDAMVIGETARKHVPLDRYTAFCDSWNSIGYPHASPLKPFAYTALENPEKISALLDEGKRVFIHVPVTIRSTRDWERFIVEFKLEEQWKEQPKGPWIAELFPVSGQNLSQKDIPPSTHGKPHDRETCSVK
ncbi:MAG: hypothetical protein KJ645_11710 [Planctomycetes bacterium]|nr:hypothetical protein [Planctomycetota bacterium]